MALDGITIVNEAGEIVFQRAAPPSDEEFARISGKVSRLVDWPFERRGLESHAATRETDPAAAVDESGVLLPICFHKPIGVRDTGSGAAPRPNASRSENVKSPPAESKYDFEKSAAREHPLKQQSKEKL
jgi:hypothetical protein